MRPTSAPRSRSTNCADRFRRARNRPREHSSDPTRYRRSDSAHRTRAAPSRCLLRDGPSTDCRPIVATVRSCRAPRLDAARATSGACARISSCMLASRAVTSAPMVSVAPSKLISRSAGMRLTLTIAVASAIALESERVRTASPSRLPPASTCACGAKRSSSTSASSTKLGSKYCTARRPFSACLATAYERKARRAAEDVAHMSSGRQGSRCESGTVAPL